MTRNELIDSLNIKAIGVGVPYLADKLKWKNGNIDVICYCQSCYNIYGIKSYVCCSIENGNIITERADNYCAKCGKKVNWDKTNDFYKDVEGIEDGC